jgi:hypothetical protein
MWRSHIGEPKTRNSKAPIPVIALLRRMLDEHRVRCGNPETGVMFKTRNHTPPALNNLLHDQILPVLERCQHCGSGRAEHPGAEHTYSRDNSRPEWHGLRARGIRPDCLLSWLRERRMGVTLFVSHVCLLIGDVG